MGGLAQRLSERSTKIGADGATKLARTGIGATVRPLILDLGCCGVSAIQLAAPGYDLPGFDGTVYDLEPEQATVLIVAGRVSPRLMPYVRSIYERLARPKWTIAYGTCAISGAIYNTLELATILPVDVMVPGCPPHTNALKKALAHLSLRERQ